MSGRTAQSHRLANLRNARQGQSRAKQWKPKGDASIYDEVSERDYEAIVRGRLDQDDFVEDDGVDGYIDHGMDDFEGDMADSEDEREIKKRQKAAAKATKAKPKPPPPEPAPMSAYRTVKSEAVDSEFLENLLQGMVAEPAKPNPRKRKGSPSRRETDYTSYRDNQGASSDGPDDFPEPKFSRRREALSSDDEAFITPIKRFKSENGTGINIHQTTSQVDQLRMDDPYDEMENDYAPIDLDDIDGHPVKKEESPIALSKLSGNGAHPSAVKNESAKVQTGPPSWLAVHASLPVAIADTVGGGSSNLASTRVQATEEDGSLRMFWLDYLEVDAKVYLVGKVLDKSTNRYVSACVAIENIERNLFVLPRERRMEGDYETDIQPEKRDVQADFTEARQKFDIKRCAMKWVKRKYAFGEPGVPTQETLWMKVVYPFSEPAMPSNLTSPNIARIFGTNTSAFELFVIKRKIMGPCWLQIKNAEIANKGASWCKLEATVSDPKDVNPLTDNSVKDMPPLTIMSLTLRTVVNHKENKREIVSIASRVWEENHIESTTPLDKQPSTAVTFIRPLEKYPKGFESVAAQSRQSKMHAMANERALLNNFLALVQRYDPDVIVGHDFLGVSLDILLHRMKELKAEHWSRISRFKRKGWPSIGKQGTNLRFLNGRLLCDLASDGAKGMIASTTWSLTEMVASQLKIQRQDIDPDDTALFFDAETSTAQRLLEFVQHCELDAFLQMAITWNVKLLPLTRQLTNIAGNSWNKTLNGGRAERNEYILLHEFHSLKYICPDKTWGKKAAAAAKVEAEEGDGAATNTKSKRDKYKGGLVFEPKRGLWDKIILVMDFNSLYPSIIQEYNIDFTTVETGQIEESEDQIPPVPDPSLAQGVLPRLIADLVKRRKAVKGYMKSPGSTEAERKQWDIKQQALKLTANSMYWLPWLRGREILTNTKQLAESMGLDVVYGDTDSVFVNSGHLDQTEALKIAHQFKKAVNDRYRLLEIDVDGVFQRLLLLQKKKYAAIKVENNVPTMEVKGLDMKRREYSALSKNTSRDVLGFILSGEETEVVVEKIHDYLTAIGQNVRNGSVQLDDYTIFKRLGKNPEDYPDAKTQPHVQVALRMKAKGQSAKAGDVIPYIFCLADDGTSSKTAQADRAFHPDDIRRSGGQLKIDFEHYLSQQILPPIERLCDPIEGTDRSRLAECLGLDPSRYHAHSTGGGGEDRAFEALDSQKSDAQRFKSCDPFIVTCRKCKSARAWHPPSSEDNELVTGSGVVCATASCAAPITAASLQTQLEVQIRAHIGRYYDGWMVCDDEVCGNRTRMMRVYGKRCLREGCRGAMNPEYNDSQLYTQLLFYSSLFDSQKLLNSSKGSSRQEHITALVGQNADTLLVLAEVVERHLDECGRRWVDLKDLFGFMSIKGRGSRR
ncbi:related to POL1-DNA-directed DNA polymerase alpha, 180 KD subunit [Serendipita indica DSM 11827]|uniref:DNA polymerase n=1 Tax=Serendipita indica (strain DSM 11827) TaxID=1109443 RepID=G4TDY0_SERID|nr:related to POL1-DNA-directed DNA polymerase alpha, 180 KD subunit [Serendipita indica DSM 11827]